VHYLLDVAIILSGVVLCVLILSPAKKRDAESGGASLRSSFMPRWLRYGMPVLGGAVALAIVGGALFAWSGLYDVAASAGHWPITHDLLHYTMKQSVAFHAPHLKVPPLDDPKLVFRGATHYHTGCAPCHGARGTQASPIERRATPPPPPLYDMARAFSPDQLHWIVKHGIKMTAMPAWPTQQRDDEVWAIVAFLEKLPGLDQKSYQDLAIGPIPPSSPSEQKPGLTALAEPPPEVGASCARCHGIDGHGRERAFPNIAGLNLSYILEQLRAFDDGTRPSGFMQPVAANLTDREKQKLAAYFGSLPRADGHGPVANVSDVNLGESIAQFGVSGRVPGCLSCHSLRPSDLSPGVPQLTGQPSDYLTEQLLLFRSGVRAQTHDDKIMARFAKELTETQIRAVSAYFASLAPQGAEKTSPTATSSQ
jgi:cytochrome c553